jgi:hypothetical protein
MRIPLDASRTPAAAPMSANTTLSIKSCRMILPFPAPSATRMPISLARLVERTSNRLATFAQAMRSTQPTAPSNTNNAPRALPTIWSRSDRVAEVVHVEVPLADALRDRSEFLAGGGEGRAGREPTHRLEEV